MRLFSPAFALVKIPEPFFARNPIETRVVLSGILDATDILRLLLNGGHSAKPVISLAPFGASAEPISLMKLSRQ